jgi:hypothetical protein
MYERFTQNGLLTERQMCRTLHDSSLTKRYVRVSMRCVKTWLKCSLKRVDMRVYNA